MIAHPRAKSLLCSYTSRYSSRTQTDTKYFTQYLGLLSTNNRQNTREARLLLGRDRLQAMSIILTQRCVSAEPWFIMWIPSASEDDKEYRVLVPWPDDKAEDLTCECMSFVHRGHCRHQQEAFDLLCRWTSVNGPEEQTKEQHYRQECPRCGETTILQAEFE